jgi:hypothetical protein
MERETVAALGSFPAIEQSVGLRAGTSLTLALDAKVVLHRRSACALAPRGMKIGALEALSGPERTVG